MKTLSTLFIAAAFALSMVACGGSSEADTAESQNDTEMTTGDETAADDMATEEEAPMEEEASMEEEAPVEEGAEEGAEEPME